MFCDLEIHLDEVKIRDEAFVFKVCNCTKDELHMYIETVLLNFFISVLFFPTTKNFFRLLFLKFGSLLHWTHSCMFEIICRHIWESKYSGFILSAPSVQPRLLWKQIHRILIMWLSQVHHGTLNHGVRKMRYEFSSSELHASYIDFRVLC